MIQSILLTILVCLLIFLILSLRKNNKQKKDQEKELNFLKENYKKLLYQKKSSEVLLGQVAEKIAPFTEMFKHDPRRASFLGNPIDYIVFEEDEIVFVEVKSGNSRLSEKQKRIKNIINNKKVRWEEIKIKP